MTGAAALSLALACAAATASAQPWPKVVVQGETLVNGIYDPSVEYTPDGSVGWLSYSAVFGGFVPFGPNVETHLARSLDSGASWSFVQVINSSFPANVVLPSGPTDGVWNYEVSSLVHDPGDPGREWKLFAHRIFRRAEENPFSGMQNEPAYSWIVLRTASDPAGAWSPEVPLLSSGPLPPPPFDMVLHAINDLDPSLAGMLVYSEPGAFVDAGVLYLSLTGLTAAGPDRVVLLASDDHGDSWRYVSTPLDLADAAALGFLHFDGSALARDSEREFLLVTPGTPEHTHDGTLIFEFSDLAQGDLVSDAGGLPRVHAHVPLQQAFASPVGAGQSDYHEHNTAGGLLMPQINLPELPELFQFFSTGRRLASIFAGPVPALSPGGVALLALVLALVGTRRCARRG